MPDGGKKIAFHNYADVASIFSLLLVLVAKRILGSWEKRAGGMSTCRAVRLEEIRGGIEERVPRAPRRDRGMSGTTGAAEGADAEDAEEVERVPT